MASKITVSKPIQNGSKLRAKEDIMVAARPLGQIIGHQELFLGIGEEGTVEDLYLYQFSDDGVINHYAHFMLSSERMDGARIMFSTKPSCNVTPNFEDRFEIL